MEKKRVTSESVLKIISIIAVVFMLFVSVWILVKGFISIEHYNRVYMKPVAVTATVTYYDSYDNDGDTDYRSYVSYEVNGKKYTGIRYEDKGDKSKLTPIGEQVKIEVSPEDPSVTMKALKGDCLMLWMAWLPCLMVAGLWNFTLKGVRSKGNTGVPDKETLEKDLKLTILSHFAQPLFLTSAIITTVITLRYSGLVPEWLIIVPAVLFIALLVVVFNSIKDIKIVNNEEYTISRDKLVNKKYETSEDSATYTLYYRSGDKEWQTSVSRANYNKAKIGDMVEAVYLPNKKRPLMHYNISGDAQ